MTRLFNFPWENHLISKFVAYLRHFPKKFPTHFFQNHQVDQVKGQKCNSSVGNAEGFLFSGVFLVGVCTWSTGEIPLVLVPTRSMVQ